MGIPGDRIHLRNGVVYRNGEKLDEPYVIHKTDEGPNDIATTFPPCRRRITTSVADWQEHLPQYIQGDDIVVPPDSYFAMGDNRDVS